MIARNGNAAATSYKIINQGKPQVTFDLLLLLEKKSRRLVIIFGVGLVGNGEILREASRCNCAGL